MGHRAAELSELRDRVEGSRHFSWRGTWGARLSTDSDWSAMVDETSLHLNREKCPLHTVRAVRWSRRLIWARILVEYNDGTTSALGGLTNRAALAFVDSLTAACVLNSLEKLNALIADVEHQRETSLNDVHLSRT